MHAHETVGGRRPSGWLREEAARGGGGMEAHSHEKARGRHSRCRGATREGARRRCAPSTPMGSRVLPSTRRSSRMRAPVAYVDRVVYPIMRRPSLMWRAPSARVAPSVAHRRSSASPRLRWMRMDRCYDDSVCTCDGHMDMEYTHSTTALMSDICTIVLRGCTVRSTVHARRSRRGPSGTVVGPTSATSP